ncbi:MAG: hypothetical protein IT306_06355 [Chloroflexi bacterium]|nr:hypothetical protein [Chloroflexota bacterium]
MSIVGTAYQHIVLDDSRVPLIAGTTMKVVELVVAQQMYGWSAEELVFQSPTLTLGQVHSALAYSWDHQQKLDADSARRLSRAGDLCRAARASQAESHASASSTISGGMVWPPSNSWYCTS